MYICYLYFSISAIKPIAQKLENEKQKQNFSG